MWQGNFFACSCLTSVWFAFGLGSAAERKEFSSFRIWFGFSFSAGLLLYRSVPGIFSLSLWMCASPRVFAWRWWTPFTERRWAPQNRKRNRVREKNQKNLQQSLSYIFICTLPCLFILCSFSPSLCTRVSFCQQKRYLMDDDRVSISLVRWSDANTLAVSAKSVIQLYWLCTTNRIDNQENCKLQTHSQRTHTSTHTDSHTKQRPKKRKFAKIENFAVALLLRMLAFRCFKNFLVLKLFSFCLEANRSF